ncbi:MAG: hypothetical protein WCT32_04995 [Patescibacteria group bacterium]|jgi:hypothetical protein
MKNRQHKIRYSVTTFVVGAGLLTVALRGFVNADMGSAGDGVSPTVIVIAVMGALFMIFGLMIFLFALATSR